MDNESGSKFSGSLETNKNTLDCIVWDFGQQRAYKLIFRTKFFREWTQLGICHVDPCVRLKSDRKEVFVVCYKRWREKIPHDVFLNHLPAVTREHTAFLCGAECQLRLVDGRGTGQLGPQESYMEEPLSLKCRKG